VTLKSDKKNTWCPVLPIRKVAQAQMVCQAFPDRLLLQRWVHSSLLLLM